MSKINVCLTFDLDAETVQVRKKEDIVRISKGQFAINRGVPRILDLLERKNIQATFFTCGWVADEYPETVELIHSKGHELAAHGYLHEELDKCSRDEEEEIHKKTFKALRKITNEVIGFRAPYWQMSENTLDLIAEQGCLYDSSLMADDRPYKIITNKYEKSLIEFPVEWFLDDWILFEQKQLPPSSVLEIWLRQFYALKRSKDIEKEMKVFNITMHPSCIGHCYRLQTLKDLITVMKVNRGQFLRMGDLAKKL